MMKLSVLFSGLIAFQAFAAPNCLKSFDCFEHNGKIIDIRSKGAQSLDKLQNCDPIFDNCLNVPEDMPRLSESEFKRLTKKEGPKLFIPIELRSSDMYKLAGALSLGVVVFNNDRAVMDYVQETKTPQMHTAVDIGNLMGSQMGIVPVAAGAYFMGAVMKQGKLKNVGLFTIGAGIATQIVTEAFKKTFERVRPNQTDSPYDFFQDGNNSFFSGHNSGAFSLATVISEVYKDKPLVPYLAYGVAALTMYSRMYDEKHWGSDVLMGAIAGHLITKIFIRSYYASENPTSSKNGLLVLPVFSKDSIRGTYGGVVVSWSKPKKHEEMNCANSGLKDNELLSACIEEAFNSN